MKPTAVKVRCISRFVWMTLMLGLCWATTQSTACPIRLPDSGRVEERNAGQDNDTVPINVQLQISKPIESEISTTKTGKREQENLTFDNPTPSADNSSVHKSKSDSNVLVSAKASEDTSTEGLNSKKNDIDKRDAEYDEYVISEEPVMELVTTTKKENAYNIQSASENPYSYESNNLNGPLKSEEVEDLNQKNKFVKNRLSTNVDLQTGTATKNKMSTTNNSKEKQLEGSFNNDPPPFDDDLPTHSTTNGIIPVINAQTPEANSNSVEDFDLEKNNTNDAEYDEYVISEEPVTESVTTTKKENAYNIESASENPSSNESNNLKGSIVSEEDEDEDIKQKDKFEKHSISEEPVTELVTTTKKENAYSIPSASENPYTYESNNLNGPLMSEEDEDLKQKNKFEKHVLPTNAELQTDKATKNVMPTAKTTKEEQLESSINNPSPFNDDSSAYTTTSGIITVIYTTTTEGYSTSTKDLDLEKNDENDEKYDEYVISEEVKELVTTTKKENAYNIESASENPYSYESNHLNGPLISEENEDSKQKHENEKHMLPTNDQLQTNKTTKHEISATTTKKAQESSFNNNPLSFDEDMSTYNSTSGIISVVNATNSEGYSSSTEKLNLEKNVKNDTEYDEYVISEEPVTESVTTTKKENAYNIKSASENPSSNESNNLKDSLVLEEDEDGDEDIKQKNEFEKHRLPTNVHLQTDKVTKNETSMAKTTKEDQELFFDDNPPPFDDDSSAYKMTSDMVPSTTPEGHRTSTGKLDVEKSNKNDAEYDEYLLPKNVQLQTEKATKNENSTTDISKKEQESSFNNNSPPFDGDSSSYNTKSGIVAVVNTTSERYSTSTGELDLKKNNKNDAEYEEYVISEEQVTKPVTTTKKEIPYDIQSASQNPSTYESNNVKGNFLSEADEDIIQTVSLEDSGSPDNSINENVIPYETSTVIVDTTHNSGYYSMNNSSDSNQNIDFVPLEDTAIDGIQNISNGPLNWDKIDVTDADVLIKSIDSEEYNQVLQNSSNSHEETSEKNDDYNEYVIDAKDHKQKLHDSSSLDENKGRTNTGAYDEYGVNLDDFLNEEMNENNMMNNTQEEEQFEHNKNAFHMNSYSRPETGTSFNTLNYLINLLSKSINNNLVKNTPPPHDSFGILQPHHPSSLNPRWPNDEEVDESPYAMFIERMKSDCARRLMF